MLLSTFIALLLAVSDGTLVNIFACYIHALQILLLLLAGAVLTAAQGATDGDKGSSQTAGTSTPASAAAVVAESAATFAAGGKARAPRADEGECWTLGDISAR